ncbi:S8 family serine peptidase [Actinomadura viridis]|uniref:Type VII secretion-associated serine protease mycosin n=1 Tax=Actinomadura viridis TaxID=58110 RepID=A0A931DSW7_9ACTN|nr:S8 family serine peptidase [Actinomadura viridis]MBG6093251.1 type VII secretion-associated serine protease mycosin [Actinomadura viridis]
MRVAGLVAGAGCVVLTSALAPPVWAAPAAPAVAPACNPAQGQPASQITQQPWPQRRLDFEEAWKVTRGEGVTVAVVDSGVSARHPQLAGRVVAHFDATKTTPEDCFQHGTEVAGIIAAADQRQSRGVPFVGVAPGARLVNAKFTSGESTNDNTLLPKAIMWAADRAQVINVSVAAPDTPELRRAVRYAQRKDALIVAAAGNVQDDQRGKEQQAYPASYPGVLSVAAADENGTIADFSNLKTRVDVSAPGANIISTGPTGYIGGLGGTSFGAPYAAGVAALVRSRHKNLNYQQVIQRIKATAEGDNGTGSGSGMISPMQAVTGLVNPGAGQAAPRAAAGAIDIGGRPPVDHRTRGIGAGIAVGAVILALAVAFGGAVIPLGRRRGWRPGRARSTGGGEG